MDTRASGCVRVFACVDDLAAAQPIHSSLSVINDLYTTIYYQNDDHAIGIS